MRVLTLYLKSINPKIIICINCNLLKLVQYSNNSLIVLMSLNFNKYVLKYVANKSARSYEIIDHIILSIVFLSNVSNFKYASVISIVQNFISKLIVPPSASLNGRLVAMFGQLYKIVNKNISVEKGS